jgi:hypothetical protein
MNTMVSPGSRFQPGDYLGDLRDHLGGQPRNRHEAARDRDHLLLGSGEGVGGLSPPGPQQREERLDLAQRGVRRAAPPVGRRQAPPIASQLITMVCTISPTAMRMNLQ